MKRKIKWNNYIYSVEHWADYLNTAYPIANYPISASLTGHACERIYLEIGQKKKLRYISNEMALYDAIGNVEADLSDIAENILDIPKLDINVFRKPKKGHGYMWIKSYHIKETKEGIAWERWGLNKDGTAYSSLLLTKEATSYIIDSKLILFAQDDLDNRAVPLFNKRKELDKQVVAFNNQIEKYEKLIEKERNKIHKVFRDIANIKHQLSNKSPLSDKNS